MKRNIRENISLLLGFILMMSVTSCVYEDMEPCPVEVRFVYDYNMEFADGFPQQVKALRLYVFDQDGQLATTREASADNGFGEGYRMPLDLKPGTYTLVAWATDNAQAAQEAYATPEGETEGLSLANRYLRTQSAEGSLADYAKALPKLWNGMATQFTVTGEAPALATIHLTQDVKRFRIMLQSTDGKALNPVDYSLRISAANHQMNYDNSLRPCPELGYTPYIAEQATIDNGEGTPVNALVSELNTLRLPADQAVDFTVRDEAQGKNLFDVNLIRYLELMRMDQYADMPLQEYLDRENEYQIILFMGQNGTLLSIQINAWTLVLNHDTEL